MPLYHVIIAGGRDPADSQATSYLLSATSGLTVLKICAVNGFTRKTKPYYKNKPTTLCSMGLHIRSKTTIDSFGSVSFVLIA